MYFYYVFICLVLALIALYSLHAPYSAKTTLAFLMIGCPGVYL